MGRNVQVVLLCEDKQHEVFARRFLRNQGWFQGRIRAEVAPGGGGDAKQFVRQHFPGLLSVYRARRGWTNQVLLVMIDGDNEGVQPRLDELKRACQSLGIPPRSDDERVAVFVPTWQIETWLAYLSGETVDEAKSDYPRLGRQRECKEHAEVLHGMCQNRELRQPAPPSLTVACEEYRQRIEGIAR